MNNRRFYERHIGPDHDDCQVMLDTLAVSSLDALIDETVPQAIHLEKELDLPAGSSEAQALAQLASMIDKNILNKSFIGAGFHGTFIPPVIARNLFENPAWYTAYTPYQAEISQGRLELLFHFQTLVGELTGLPVANASLLDEATAFAEANACAVRFFRGARTRIHLLGALHPHLLAVAKTRAETQDIDFVEGGEIDEKTAAIVVPWPDTYGVFHNFADDIRAAKAADALVIAVADPLALTIMETPATWGADMVAGSMQRYGVPMGFGGPHAGYMAVSSALTRLIPGRIVGQSIDTQGRVGYRLALQTREQHIRRDKATSNICTAQALLANMAAAYAIWHGGSGLKSIAYNIHNLAQHFHQAVENAGFETEGTHFFDCICVKTKNQAQDIVAAAHAQGYLLRLVDEKRVCVNFDELSTNEDVTALAALFGAAPTQSVQPISHLPGKPRHANFLTQPVFNTIKSETQMMRFLRHLADKDLALDRAMIPLGSCTMKLNAAAEMMPVGWPKIAGMHPFAPKSDVKGYLEMIGDLEKSLCAITGFSAVSFQPNSGAQGEYAGLLAIRRYHQQNGEEKRHICLIPASAHGTNPASAQMAGMEVVVVQCLSDGDVDIEDLKRKAEQHKDDLAVLMITYPSTHGVYEENMLEICAIVHENGGQVYFDGANLNALVGLGRPADMGADVCHMNLHKTFAIPHGGGGPGVGPIGVASHLVPFLPGHTHCGTDHAVSSAPFGSASILAITWMYIRMMGGEGLTLASKTAILSANYIAARLSFSYPVLYRGKRGRVAHECIIDTRILKDEYGITVDDIAKRLIDYGFHAPTMSFPVAGTLMIEPTESEPKAEIDRLCDALIAIAEEAKKVGRGEWPKDDNPLVNAPHTLAEVLADDWSCSYSRQIAAFPDTARDMSDKYWPPVSRIDNVAGDRNLICTCPLLSNY